MWLRSKIGLEEEAHNSEKCINELADRVFKEIKSGISQKDMELLIKKQPDAVAKLILIKLIRAID